MTEIRGESMALGDPYATLPELKSYLKITDAADDAELNDALASASKGIEDFCHRQFNSAGAVSARTYHPDSHCMVEVDDFSTTAGLVVKTAAGNDGVFGTTWLAADYQLEPLNGVVDGRPGWPYWKIGSVGSRTFRCVNRATVEVTANWGWAAVPSPVKQACLIIAAETFKLKDAPFGVAGFGEFGAVRVRDNPMVMRKLQPYARYSVLVA